MTNQEEKCKDCGHTLVWSSWTAAEDECHGNCGRTTTSADRKKIIRPNESPRGSRRR